jgi:hypothetical protein
MTIDKRLSANIQPGTLTSRVSCISINMWHCRATQASLGPNGAPAACGVAGPKHTGRRPAGRPLTTTRTLCAGPWPRTAMNDDHTYPQCSWPRPPAIVHVDCCCFVVAGVPSHVTCLGRGRVLCSPNRRHKGCLQLRFSRDFLSTLDLQVAANKNRETPCFEFNKFGAVVTFFQ